MTRFLLAALAVLLPLAPSAQILDPDRLDAMFGSEPTVEVNLRGSLLTLAAEAARADDPEIGLMLDGLRGVTVRIYSASEDHSRFLSRMDEIGDEFERDGWLTMIRVRGYRGDADGDGDEDEGDVWVYVLDDGERFDGMAVMALEPEDDTAVFVHIDGTIDPADVARLTNTFGDVDIDFDDDDD
ncbi:MAG: DUF4252 domain-containing protein [Bacteroidota bacterium]